MARTPPFSGRGTPTHSVTRASETPHRDRANTNSTVARRNVLIPTLPGGAQNSLNEQRQRLLPEFPNVASNDSDQENNEGGAAVGAGQGMRFLLQRIDQQNRQILAALQQPERQMIQGKVNVPRAVSAEVRIVTRTLRDQDENPLAWDMTKGRRDTVNETVNTAIRMRVRNVHKDLSEVVLEAALKSHFQTRKKGFKRTRAGMDKQHQKIQRKRQRKQNLLKSRLKANRVSTSLADTEREKIKSILTADFVSSEESMSDDANDGPQNQSGSDEEGMAQVTRRKILIKRPLSWRSEMANGFMESLDRKTKRRLSGRSHTMLLERRTGAPSTRQPPAEAPEWAIRG